MAARHGEEFALGYAFTAAPVRVGERIVVQVGQRVPFPGQRREIRFSNSKFPNITYNITLHQDRSFIRF